MDVSADKLAKVYIKIRDKKQDLKRKFDEEEKVLNDQLDIIGAKLLELCKENGADSMRTPHGTVVRTTQKRHWATDWSAFHKFVLENEAPYLLERRVAQGAMNEWIDENPDNLPPGLTTDSKYVVTVRRSRQ